MADGYARAGGGIGAALVVPGPGLLNAAAGLSTAYSASSPVLMIAGQVPRRNIGRTSACCTRSTTRWRRWSGVTKWRRRVLEVGDVAGAVRAAVRQLKTRSAAARAHRDPARRARGRGRGRRCCRRPRATRDGGAGADDRPGGRDAAGRAAPGHLRRWRRARLRRPRGAGRHRRAPPGRHRAPRPRARASVNDSSDLSLGAALWPKNPLRRYLDAADLVLVVGSRLAIAGLQPDQQVVQVDVDPDEIGRNHGLTFGVVGDARLTLERMLERLRPAPPRAVAQGRARGAPRGDRRPRHAGAELSAS